MVGNKGAKYAGLYEKRKKKKNVVWLFVYQRIHMRTTGFRNLVFLSTKGGKSCDTAIREASLGLQW